MFRKRHQRADRKAETEGHPMSIYKSAKSAPYFHYDFRLSGRRFFGSTKCTARKEAQKVERQERARAKTLIAATKFVAGSLQLDHVAARFWHEVGQHHAG